MDPQYWGAVPKTAFMSDSIRHFIFNYKHSQKIYARTD